MAWSKAFTNACFSDVLICMIFLLTAARLMEEEEYRSIKWEKKVVEVCQEQRKKEREREML